MKKKIIALIITLCIFFSLNAGLISAETTNIDRINNAVPFTFNSSKGTCFNDVVFLQGK